MQWRVTAPPPWRARWLHNSAGSFKLGSSPCECEGSGQLRGHSAPVCESLGGEDYKFEDISAEDIGPLNMMYGKISSVYQYLRKLIDELDFDEDYLIEHADIGNIGEFWQPPEVQVDADIGDREDEELPPSIGRNS